MSAGSGVVSVRFDVTGNEQLIAALKTIATSSKGLTTEFTAMQTKLNAPMGGLGPLQNLSAGFTSAEAKVTSFKSKLASIGSQLGQNATSFGVATASIWGVYNAYDSLEKVQIRAHSAAVRVQTLETTLASLTERRRIAVEKGNLTGEQMAVLNERIANTQDKLTVAQERSADVAQDVQEAWAGFLSQIGPQVIAAGGAITQLFTVMTQKGPEGVSALTKLRTSFTSLFSSLGGAGGGAIGGISSMFTRLKTAIIGVSPAMGILDGGVASATGKFGKLKEGLSGLGNILSSSRVALIGMAGALGLAGAAAFSFFNIMKKGADAKALNEIILTGTASIEQLKKQMETLKAINADWGTQAESFFFSGPLGKMIKPVTTEGMNEELIKGIQAQINVKEVGQTIQGMFDSIGPQPLSYPVDFKLMSPEVQANIKGQMAQILAIINNPTNWKAKIDPSTGKELFSQASVQQFTINALTPLIEGLQKTVQSGAFDSYIQRATDGVQKKLMTYMTQAQAFTGETGKAAVAAIGKSFAPTGFEPGSATEAAYKKVVERNKQLAEAQKAYQVTVDASNKVLEDQKNIAADLNAEDNKLYLTFGGLNRATLTNAEVRAKLLEIQEKQAKGYEKEELNILDLAAANDVYSADLANLAATEGDHVTQMNNILAESINYTSALDDQAKNQKLVSEGFRDGIIQSKEFFDNLVKSTTQNAVFNASLAEGAYSLGINSEMLAFSSSKMQELITTTYEQSQAFSELAIAAATDTSFLNDNVLIQAVLNDAMIKGAQSANDWTISMISSTQAAKDEHGQLIALATTMGINLPKGIQFTTEELHTLMTAFQDTGSEAFALDKMMNEKLRPSFEHFGDIFSATSWKEFKSSWKELGKSGGLEGIPKDLKSSLKDIGSDLIDVNKHAKEATNVIDALLVSAYSDRQKGTKSGLKALLEDVKDIPGNDKIGPFKTALAELIALPKEERTKALMQYTDAFAAYKDAVKPDSPGGTIITSGEAENINKLTEAAKNGANPVDTFAASIDNLSKKAQEMLKTDWSKFGKFVESGVITSPDAGYVNPEDRAKQTPTDITPPKPVVFPPPDLRNILTGVSKAEIMMSEMVKYAAGLTISFPLPDIGNVITAVSHAQIAAGDVVRYIAGLKLVFPKPIIDAVITGVSQAQIAIGAVQGYIAGLTLAFQKPNVQPVTIASTQANATIKTVSTFITGMKMAFQKPNIDAIISAVGAARKSIATVQNAVNSLKLKFPSIDISNINSSVDSAQKKINSLKGTTVTNHVRTVFDNAGGNILNDIKLMSAAAGKLFTTNGEQLFRVGDNPGGRETIAMIPHDKPGPIIDKLNQMFPNVYSTMHKRARTPAMTSISGSVGGSRQERSGPTQVNVTTQVYLFPGSQMFKQYVKQIMLEDLSRYATA